MDKRMRIKISIFFLLLFVFSTKIMASHLMGGNIGYEYMGLQSNGKYLYKVKLTTYIDCSPTSEIPYVEYPLKVGIYSNDLLNQNANKMIVDSLLLYVDDTIVYTPFLPAGCNIGANTCIIQARYSGYIELDPSVNGYFLYYERCCRNSSILNLQPDGSDAFLSYIPPTNIANSTPVFLYPPIPLLCATDTASIFNTAMDADGDSLVYEFSTPFNGFGSISDPNPNLPAPTLSWPVPTIDYVTGFTYNTPFSFFGFATINNQNGVATYSSMQEGTFVVCIAVKEYRSGVLIGTTYRDMQLLFNNCPINLSPHLVENLQKNYTITQGDTLCFQIKFLDQDNDSVSINATGDIFNPLIVDSPATFFISQLDSNKATGNFCWNIPCTIDTGIYQFTITSLDNGCPPAERNEFYSIHIIEPTVPTLMGTDTVCLGEDSVLFWMTPDNHFQYNWNITGGTIAQNNGDSILVSWNPVNTGNVLVDVYTVTGCYVGSDSMQVNSIPLPIADFSYDSLKTDCGGTYMQFTNNSQGADHYLWDFGTGYQSTYFEPDALFPFGNSYIVMLTAINTFGCSDVEMDTVSTDPLVGLVAIKPVNVFTPNDDGTNDVLDFSLPNQFLECAKVYVYDRWGLLMYESSNTDFSWNGKVGGKRVAVGIYYWIVDVNGLMFKGFLHVFE